MIGEIIDRLLNSCVMSLTVFAVVSPSVASVSSLSVPDISTSDTWEAGSLLRFVLSATTVIRLTSVFVSVSPIKFQGTCQSILVCGLKYIFPAGWCYFLLKIGFFAFPAFPCTFPVGNRLAPQT